MKNLTIWILKGHSIRELMITGGGAFVAISIIAYLSYRYGTPLLLASFGASTVLVFGMWESAALAMAAALVLMIVTDTIHPPGGATALICVVEGAGYSFIIMPVLVGALILLVTGLIVNKCSPGRCYSLYGNKKRKFLVKLKEESKLK